MAHQVLLNTGDNIDESEIQTAFAAMGGGRIERDALSIQYHDADDTIDTEAAVARVPNGKQDIPLSVDAIVGYGLEANAVNNVWLAVDPSAATDADAVGLRHNTTGVAPSDPHLLIAEVDTNESGSRAVTLKNRGSLPELDGTDLNPRSIGSGTQLQSLDTAALSERDYYPPTMGEIQSSLDAARNAGGGTVHAPARVGTIDTTIEVAPEVTLHLPAGCVLEPTGVFDMIQLRGAGGESTSAVGQLTGPGMPRPRPSELERSGISNFDGAAHVLVDGADDIRPSRSTARSTLSQMIDNVRIVGAIDTTGGYGIHLKADTKRSYIWYQAINAHIFGCEDAYRLTATGAESATVNGNQLSGNIIKPTCAIRDVLGDPDANRFMGNAYAGSVECTEKMDEVYHLEGDQWSITGYDFDIFRAGPYVRFGDHSHDNYVAPETQEHNIYARDNGERNTIRRVNEDVFDSWIEAGLTADQSITDQQYTKVKFTTDSTFGGDRANEFDSGANKFVAETDGLYAITASITIGAPDETQCYLALMKNGVRRLRPGLKKATGPVTIPAATTTPLSRGDAVWIEAYVDSGGRGANMTVSGAKAQTDLTIRKV